MGGGNKPPGKTGNVFRSLKDEPCFGEIYAMSESEAKEACVTWQLLPTMEKRTCWRCGSALKIKNWTGRPSMGVCTKAGCPVRFTIATAYTVMYNAKLTYRQYLMVAWCFSYQERQDQTE